MNRITLLSLTLLLTLIFLPACSAVPPTDTSQVQTTSSSRPSSSEPALTTTADEGQPTVSLADMTVEIEGVEYSLLGEASGLIAALGEPSAFSEAPSCLYEGTDKTYEYDDLIIYTITKGGVDLIDGIDLISSRYPTLRGVSVGNDQASIIAAYGEPAQADYDLVYVADPSQGDSSPTLTFILDQDKISVISFYSGSNNQAP